ncbi:MAG: hydantoinase/oxoprolinase family protein [Rhodobacteraceae bacterium]|nr:hydantoinase/oxoprolinase family protein [Paracoccaceae bacterium]
MPSSYRVAADIGGTFTDIVYQDCQTGACGAAKVLSTPDNPALAVLNGINIALSDDVEIDFFVHGTTVGLNALLTRSGARTALLTTRNFRDVYTIQGNNRGEIFSIRWDKPKPLVTLEDTYVATGRIAADGTEVAPLSTEDLDRLVEAAKRVGYEAIAISFLFSYVNPAHEIAAKSYLETRLPGVAITMSHQVSPEWREFDRTSTTVMDSYLAPVVRKYLSTLMDALEARLPEDHGLHVMESNGGVMSARTASKNALQTLLSGPVGGTIGGKALSAQTGRQNLICIDMGGTSFDASLIIEGQPSASNETVLEGLPVQMSVVDIHVIGAGGGSLAWTEAGAVRVGPQSAGSMPGPVCYGLGGTEPTVSDANLVLGRLDSANFGGKIMLDRNSATEALAKMGTEFGMSAMQMAQGVVDIINAKMADAIRTITIQQGIDPRDFTLVAFGGAGPAQAAALAEELQIGEVMIPTHPGAFSAWGMLQTDMRHDFKETMYGFWDLTSVDDLTSAFDTLEDKGRAYMLAEDVVSDNLSFERSIDFRYHGQEYVLTIPVPTGPLDMDQIRQSFDLAYERQYGHSSPEGRVEMANIRLSAIVAIPRPDNSAPEWPAAQSARRREVYFDGVPLTTRILDRAALAVGKILSGPAIIEEGTTTTLLPPGWTAQVIEGGHMALRKEQMA